MLVFVINIVFVSESIFFMDCLENFDKLNWKGKVMVFVVVVVGLVVVLFVGVKLVWGLYGGLRNIMFKKGGIKEGGGKFFVYDVVVKGFVIVEVNVGFWLFLDFIFGFVVILKVRYIVFNLCE